MAKQRDDSYINPVLKYTVFLSNFIVWIIGAGLVGIGTWAYIEKNRFHHTQIETIYDAIFDISLVFIIIGIIIFSLGLAGYVGALRENIILLKCFNYFLVAIFLLLLAGALSAFLLKDKFISKLTDILQDNFITKYTDDGDVKSIVNWIQEQLQCCGVSDKGYKDWNDNEYFNCTNYSDQEKIQTVVACSVPYSCCKKPDDLSVQIKNIKCGGGVLALDETAASQKVYTRGCIKAGIAFIEDHLPLVGGVLIAFTIAILISISLVSYLKNQIEEQRSQW